MDSQTAEAEVEYELLPFIRTYKDGRVERFMGTDIVPPSFDPQTNVTSKDVSIIPDSNVTARLYLPKQINTSQKLPLLVYFHGGAFCVMSAFSLSYQIHLSALASEANVIIVSVDYRLAPEHHLPIAYEDSWAALKWAASHSEGHGTETWLNEFADFDRVFLAGDSAGGNIAHNMAMLAGNPKAGSLNMNILGVALVHSYFWGSKRIGSEENDPVNTEIADRVWALVCPSSDTDDPRLNPLADGAPCLSTLGCTRVLVCVAEKDNFRGRGWLYYETLRKCGWTGASEIIETEGENHVFHLQDPTSEKAIDFVKRLAAFFNLERPLLL